MLKGSSRRQFLKGFGIAAVTIAAGGRTIVGRTVDSRSSYNLLVVGDSFIWGQGLEEKDKFYKLIADWLETNGPLPGLPVDLKVKAHSGATIKLHKDAAEAYKKVGRDEAHEYHPEVNVGFPSMFKQVELAANEYKIAANARGADLIMLSGGITDISVAKLLDPFSDPALLPPLIEKYCRDDIYELLVHAAELHPNAVLTVVGYFPIISAKTHGSKLFNGWLESMSFPRILKPFANNPMTRSLIFRKIRKKTMLLSKIWIEESDKNLKAAIAMFNAKSGQSRAVFVPSPITEDTCLETPNTLLFRIGKKGRSEDPLYPGRQAECRKALPELKRSTGLDYPVRYCEIAAVGHPDPAGSRAYAEAIKAVIADHVR